MVALAVTVLLGVRFRFAGSALVWYDEVAAVQLAWITYYGSAYAALKGSHISVPSIFKAFPLPLRKIFFVVSKQHEVNLFVGLWILQFDSQYVSEGLVHRYPFLFYHVTFCLVNQSLGQ